MSSAVGADTERLRILGKAFEAVSAQMMGTVRTVESSIGELAWSGIDADQFRSAWSTEHRANLVAIRDRLAALGKHLMAEALQQTHASAGFSGAAGPAASFLGSRPAPGSGQKPPAARFGVSQKQLEDYDWAFKGPRGQEFRDQIVAAAKKVDLDPGLLAASLIAETRRSDYFAKGTVSSFVVGTDDYYDKFLATPKKRKTAERLIPAIASVSWDDARGTVNDVNETGRKVNSVYFSSGADALLASAIYLKHGELVLRDHAKELGADYDRLPVDTQMALTRLAFNAGHGRAKRNLRQALEGVDILIRSPQDQAGPQRKATIATARASRLNDTVFAP